MYQFLQSRFLYAYPNFSVRSLENIESVIYKSRSIATVYAGAQARIVGLNKSDTHCPVYKWLSSELHKYLNDGKIETQASFDNWHNRICNSFITECSKIGVTVQYGMAQKFLNLALKYTYCFGDSNSVSYTKFQFGHFILDGYTYYPSGSLAKYTTVHVYGGYTINTPFYMRQVLSLTRGRLTPWSQLLSPEYLTIQKNIREYFSSHPLCYGNVSHLDPKRLASKPANYQLTPFEAEFFIW